MEGEEMEEITRTINLKTVKTGEVKKTYDKVDSLSNLLKADAYLSDGKVRGHKVLVSLENKISKTDKRLVEDCIKAGTKKNSEAKKKFQEAIFTIVKKEPNNLWVQYLNAVFCQSSKISGKKEEALQSLICCIAINPNFKTGWKNLFKLYKKIGGFYKKETCKATILITKGLLLVEKNDQEWLDYATQLFHFLAKTKDVKTQKFILQIFATFLDCDDSEKRKYSAKVISMFILKKGYFKELGAQVLTSFKAHLKDGGMSMEDKWNFFHLVTKTLLQESPLHLCDFISFTFEHDLVKKNVFINYNQELAQLSIALFFKVGRYCFEAVSKMLNYMASSLEQPFERSVQNACYLYHLACGQYSKISGYLCKQALSPQDVRRIIYILSIEKLGYSERSLKVLVNDLSQDVNNKWILRRLIILMCRIDDIPIQKFGLACAYQYLNMNGFDSEILYGIGLANISIFGEAGDFVLEPLADRGCIELVIYLKSLYESDIDLKSDNLKSLSTSLNQYLLSAKLAIEKDKRNRLKKYMLQASMEIDYNAIPFEWLGHHYYMKESYNPDRAVDFLEKAIEINPYSAISVVLLAKLLSEEKGKNVGSAYLHEVKQTEMSFSWALVPICYRVGYSCLYNPQTFNDYFLAIENLRFCHFRKKDTMKYKQLIAEAYKEYGMHGPSSNYFRQCIKVGSDIDIFSLIMCSVEKGLVKKYKKLIKTARIVYSINDKHFLTLYSYVSALIEKSYSLFIANDVPYGLFLCQIGIILISRAISLKKDCIVLWKAFGDLLYICGTAPENLTRIYVPSWIFMKNKGMVCISKFECLIASARCYREGLALSNETLSSEFWYSLGLVFYYMTHCFPQEKRKFLEFTRTASRKSIESRLSWENLNMLAIVLKNGKLLEPSLAFAKLAFKHGLMSFSRELEFNLGLINLSLGNVKDAYKAFVYRRMFPSDKDLWTHFALLHAAIGEKKKGLLFILHHLSNINCVPSISEWMLYINAILNRYKTVDEAINYKNVYLHKYVNHFYKLIFQRSPTPHQIKHMTLLNYYAMGINQLQYGNETSGVENLCNFLRLMASSSVLHERYLYAFDKTCEILKTLSVKDEIELSKCLSNKDAVYKVLTAHDSIPEAKEDEYKEFVLRQIKGAFTLGTPELEFWDEENAVGYEYFDRVDHLSKFFAKCSSP